jgi:hypothetical protein
MYGGKPGEPQNTMRIFYLGHPVDIGIAHPDNSRMVSHITGNFAPPIWAKLQELSGVDPKAYVRPANEPEPPAMEEPKKSKKKKSDDDEPTEKKSKDESSAEKKKSTTGDGYTIQALCAEIGMDPTDARKILRSEKVQKPGGRWEWPNAGAAADVKKLLVSKKDEVKK